MKGSCLLLGVMLAIVSTTATPAHAQRSAADRAAHDQLMSELARLRQAASYEAAGDYAEAEKIVAQVLEANPTSLSGLLTMERVLTAQGRTVEIMGAVNRLLAADPKSVIGHQTRLRVLSGMGDIDRLEAAVRDWIAATPELETPYREAAVVWRNRGDHARAVALLEQGRKRIDRADALALELGDAYAASNDMERAADEWSRAVGDAGRGLMLVERRLQMLPDGGARVLPALVARLSAEPATFARQRAAAMLAIEAGLENAALDALTALAARTPPEEREAVLVELARRADAADLHRVALAAYQGLLAAVPDAPATVAIRSRIAELALMAGDTALAATTYSALESTSAAGSPQRRQAAALRIQLGVRDGEVDGALEDYASFRASFPDAPELDETAAAVGTVLLEADRSAAAADVLDGVRGVASAQVRGRLALRNGDLETARHEFIAAASQLRGREATAAIALATLLTRVSARGGELVAQVMAAPEAGRAEAVRAAAAAARTLAGPERAVVLDFLADAAAGAGLDEDAAALRREIVETLPRTHEAPAALLSLARAAGAAPESTEEARVLLERLIVEYPRSALAPQARAELQRLQSR